LTSQTVASHRQDVIAALEAERDIKFGFKDFFMPWTDKSPINTSWRIWLGIAIQFFQQADGNNIVSYYATYLLIHSAGMSQHQASITAAGVVLIFVAGTATGIYTVERFGRRPVLLYGAMACSFFMILFTIGLAINTKHSTIMAVVSIFLFEFVFGGSWCFMPWVYAPEISPLHVRHIGTSLAVGTEWLVTFILVKWGPLGISTIGWK
jgi:Na+/melibiose symporter-like transporter